MIQRLVLFILCAGTISFAQEKLSLTIEKAIEIGLQNSKSLHSSQSKVLASDAKVGETNTLGLPSLKLNATYSRLSAVDPFKITLGPTPIEISPSIFNNYNVKATVQQPIFTGFKISSAEKIAEYSAEATKHDFKKDAKELTYNIKNAYWNLFKAIEFKKVVDENVGQVKAHTKDAENLLAQGMATTNDVLKVQVLLSDAQVRQIDAINNVQLSMLSLNNIIGLPLSTEIVLASTIQKTTKNFSDVSNLVKKAFETRPELLAMDARVKVSEANVTMNRSGWWPQIALVGNYNYARPNQRIFPSKDEFKDTWDVSIALSYDIWTWNTTGHQTEQAEAQLTQTNDAMGQLKDGITLEVTQNYLNQKQTIERISVAEKGVQQAEENYRITNEKYKKGLALNSDLIDAEVALLQAKLVLTQSLVESELAEARLSKAIGD